MKSERAPPAPPPDDPNFEGHGVYREAFRRGLKPEPKLSLSEWAEQHAVLSSESSSVSGRWRAYPFQPGIMDAITDPEIDRITVMKSARVGYTSMLKIAIAYHIAEAPCPVMVVQPTITDAEGFSQQEIAPMLRDTPRLAGKVSDPRSRDSGNTILRKTFPGGSLLLVGANSPTGFRRVTIRLLLMDELDGYPPSAGSEGDQEKLAEKRTETFWNRKIVKGSTPTIKGVSRIERSFLRGDQRYFFVPCPHCKAYQTIKWANIRFEKERPRNAWLECEGCHAKIPHAKKRWMLDRGHWRATNQDPEPRHASFHIWAGYSLNANATWGDLAAEFLEAKQSPETLQTFINTVLGETWDMDQGEGVASEGLYGRREDYGPDPVPEGVLVCTAGVDVQDDRLEVEVLGWGVGEETWSLDYFQLIGSPGQKEVWKQLDQVLEHRYRRPDGVEIPVSATAIDTGGHHTQDSYDFVRRHVHQRVYATKGSSRPGMPVAGRPSRKEKVTLIPVGTEASKDWIYSRLKLEVVGPGYCHFPTRYDEEYFAQLTAERAIIRYRAGVPFRAYKATRPRNEALDCRVLNLVAYRLLNPNLRKVAEALRGRAAAAAEKARLDSARAAAAAAPPKHSTKRGQRPAGRKFGKLSRPGRGGWATKW